jgi:hypothetical protein
MKIFFAAIHKSFDSQIFPRPEANLDSLLLFQQVNTFGISFQR